MTQRSTHHLAIQQKDPATDPLAPLSIIRTETVLSRLPIHNLAKRGSVPIHITKTNVHGEIELSWKVSPNTAYGEPRHLAYKLDTIVMNQQLSLLGRPLPTVIRLGSIAQICRDLEVVIGGSGNASVKQALLQNAFVAILATLRYTATDGTERTLEAGFTRYSVVFTGEQLPDGTTADAVYLLLNEPYWEILNHAPTRPLNYDYLRALTPAAQRCYEIISYKLFAALKYGHPHAKLLYSEYCTFAAQQRYPDYTHVKKQMYKIHKPHLMSTYLTSVRYEATTDADGRPDWCMYYVPGPKAEAEYAAFNPRARQRAARPAAVPSAAVEPAATAVAPVPVVDEAPCTAAHALVQHFRQGLIATSTRRPSAKELQQAETLLQEQGDERARAIVTYALGEARRTNFQMQHFGAVLGYQEAALAALTQQVQQTQQQEATRQRQISDQQEMEAERAQEDRAAAVVAAFPEAQRDAYRQRVLAQLPLGMRDMDGLVARRMRHLVMEEGLVNTE